MVHHPGSDGTSPRSEVRVPSFALRTSRMQLERPVEPPAARPRPTACERPALPLPEYRLRTARRDFARFDLRRDASHECPRDRQACGIIAGAASEHNAISGTISGPTQGASGAATPIESQPESPRSAPPVAWNRQVHDRLDDPVILGVEGLSENLEGLIRLES